MLTFFKKHKKETAPKESVPETQPIAPTQPLPEPTPDPKAGFLKKLKERLSRTRKHFSEGIANIFLGEKNVDGALFEALEAALLAADVGVATTKKLIQELTEQVARKHLKDPQHLFLALKQHLAALLEPYAKPIILSTTPTPFTILMIGVNGAGKTTTIAKLAHRFKQEHQKVLLAAGDTFRAAAVEQLQIWGERNAVPVVAQQNGADSASVIYDAFVSARAKGSDILIADTAGRLHTKSNLMEELKKIKRVLGKLDATAPHETLLVLDAGNGQNAIAQAKEFHQALGIDGIVLTKLDGTAKGGVIFSIAEQLKLPIRFIGVGEQKDDLHPFNAQEFVEALFGQEISTTP